MINVTSVFESLKQSLSRRVEIEFRRFIHSTYTNKWLISTDFVTTGKERVNDTFVFTVFPYESDFYQIQEEVREASSKDIKSIKAVQETMLNYLGSRRRFTFCFIPSRNRRTFSSLQETRKSIETTINMMQGWEDAELHTEIIRKFTVLRQEAEASNFNYNLLNNMILTAEFAAVVSHLIAKHSHPEIIGWFPDRDNMTSAFGSIIHDMFSINFSTLCQMENIEPSITRLSIGMPGLSTHGKNTMWYDDLVRVPDFIAGTLARWDFRKNYIASEAPKFLQVIERVLANNPNIATVLINFSIFGVQTSTLNVKINKSLVDTSSDMPPLSWTIDFLTFNLIREQKLSIKYPCFRKMILQTSFISSISLTSRWRYGR